MSITYPSVTRTDTVNAQSQTPGALVCYFCKTTQAITVK